MPGSASPELQRSQPRRPPVYRDATVVKWVVQVVALVGVLFTLLFMAFQAGDNLRANNLSIGYGFLEVDPGFNLSEGIDTDPDTGGRALWVGMVNTMRLAVGGIFLATVIGVLVGVGRLSGNWMVRKSAGMYVEAIRNVPLLVQILAIAAVLSTLPGITLQQGPVHGWIHLSNKGLSVPRVFISDGFYQWMVFVLVGLLVGVAVKRLQQRRREVVGRETYPLASFAAVVVVFGVIGWWFHPVFGWLGTVFSALAGMIGAVPYALVRTIVCVAAVASAALWIRSRFNRLRTPAGRGKLTDDDISRMAFAGLAAVGAVLFVTVVWPGLSSWIVHSCRDLLEVTADKFSSDRTGPPIGVKRPDIVQPGRFVNYGPSGLNFTPGLASVYFGVVLYTGAFIAEIVRGGVLAVPEGRPRQLKLSA